MITENDRLDKNILRITSVLLTLQSLKAEPRRTCAEPILKFDFGTIGVSASFSETDNAVATISGTAFRKIRGEKYG
jgi:hypothetical protein